MTTPRKGAGLHGSEGKLASAVVAGTVFRAARGLRAAASQRRVGNTSARRSASNMGQSRAASPLLDSGGGLAIGGHRGMGENILAGAAMSSTMGFRENTVLSLREAIRRGATFVEFDVQVTRDGVPVVFHDNLIEWGTPSNYTSKPISAITLAEFQALGVTGEGGKESQLVRRTRDADTLKWLEDRGPWRCQAEDSLPTLQQLFEELPKGAGFDLEVKMTTLEGGGSTPPEEVSRVLNPILETARRFCSDRLVVFSSFDPDICIDLRRRDTGAAVLFLTCCGQEHPDERVRSVEAAIALASAHKLDGIVVDAERLHDREELMKTVRDSGLYLATYGRRNNQRGWVEKQFAQGVNAIIADDMGGALGSLSLS